MQLLTGEPTAGLPAEVFGALPQRYDRVVVALAMLASLWDSKRAEGRALPPELTPQ